MWRPRNPRAVAVVKLTLWSALLVWMVCTLAFGVVMAQRFAVQAPGLFGTGTWGQVLTWVGPIWIVFTTLMLEWAVARFAYKRLRRQND